MRAEQYGEPFFQAAAEPKPIPRHDEARADIAAWKVGSPNQF